jgi:hypothetical protein
MLDSQPLSGTMKSTDFQNKIKFGQEDPCAISDLKQERTFEKFNSTQRRGIHYRTRSTQNSKLGKTAIPTKRRDINPSAMFLRNPPPVEIFAQDPKNKFMKKPFLENLPSHQKSFFINKKGFLSLFEDITKINLVFSEII